MEGSHSEILDGLIRRRWNGKITLAQYRYVASCITENLSFKGKRLLDVGCGNGLLLSTISIYESPSLAIGVDPYEGEGSPSTDYSFVKEIEESLRIPSLRFQKGDALQLPFDKGSFDIVLSSQVFHHIYESTRRLRDEVDFEQLDIYRVLSNIYDVLDVKGVFVLVEAPRITALRLAQYFGLMKDVNFKTKQEPRDWIEALKKTGFRDIKIHYHTPHPVRMLRMILSSPLFRYLICGQYYIYANK